MHGQAQVNKNASSVEKEYNAGPVVMYLLSLMLVPSALYAQLAPPPIPPGGVAGPPVFTLPDLPPIPVTSTLLQRWGVDEAKYGSSTRRGASRSSAG